MSKRPQPHIVTDADQDISSGTKSENHVSNDTDRNNETTYKIQETNSHSSWGNVRSFTLGKCVLCFVCGLVFGFVMQKGRIFEPKYIRRQMVLSHFVMLKMFLSAVATGMFGMSFIAMITRTNQQFMRTCTQFYNSLTEKGILSSIVGGLFLGIGMVLAGSCPTSIFSQVGAMLPNAGYTFAGAICGTVLYGILKPTIDSYLQPIITESCNPWTSSPYFILALPLAAMFAVLVCAFELLIPWTAEFKFSIPEGTSYLRRKAWPPYFSGIIIGLLQVPLILGIGETLGGSSSLITMVSQIFVGPLKRLSPFIAKYRRGFASWWQIFYVAGVMSGSYLSAYMSNTFGTSKGVPVYYAFSGGLLMIFGARIAGGCTSGHGLSGMGFLSILSFITVSSLFAGAIPTALIMRYLGVLKVV